MQVVPKVIDYHFYLEDKRPVEQKTILDARSKGNGAKRANNTPFCLGDKRPGDKHIRRSRRACLTDQKNNELGNDNDNW